MRQLKYFCGPYVAETTEPLYVVWSKCHVGNGTFWQNETLDNDDLTSILAAKETLDCHEEGYLFYEKQKKAYQDIYYNIKNYYPEEYVVLLLTALFSKAHSDDLFNSDDLLEYLRIIQPTIRGISKDPEQLSLDILYDKEFIDSRLFLLVRHDALTMTIIDGKRRYYRLQSHQLASLPQRQLDIYNYLNEFCKSIYYPEGLPSEKP